ncbi:MAG: homocysteine S-methyltransferase family protein [Woeseiaceae bacterium]|nr:homocysteine S-methyltransferase family protein [Woeseiaceae bacterium]
MRTEQQNPGIRCGPDWLNEKLSAGEIVIIDGGMGTELEARGVPMNEKAWSGEALLTHADVVREIHVDYIAAGAEVIITNTFAAGHQLLASAGLIDEVVNINRKGVEIALQARGESAEENVAIAGSMSPWIQYDESPSEKTLEREFREQADVLAEAGVDLIVLEMCSHPVYSPLILEAAIGTGLPVWLGVSCKQNDDGQLVGFEPPHADFRKLVEQLANGGASVINIMHSTVDDTDAGLAVLREFWQGPTGVYPESGYFVMPNWQFVDIIEPDELVSRARGWVDRGVQILGGCCGLGVPHVAALKAAFG